MAAEGRCCYFRNGHELFEILDRKKVGEEVSTRKLLDSRSAHLEILLHRVKPKGSYCALAGSEEVLPGDERIAGAS
jgi:hypothetical protein